MAPDIAVTALTAVQSEMKRTVLMPWHLEGAHACREERHQRNLQVLQALIQIKRRVLMPWHPEAAHASREGRHQGNRQVLQAFIQKLVCVCV